MVAWYWLFAAASGGGILGLVVMGLLAAGARSDLEMEIHRLRKELTA